MKYGISIIFLSAALALPSSAPAQLPGMPPPAPPVIAPPPPVAPPLVPPSVQLAPPPLSNTSPRGGTYNTYSVPSAVYSTKYSTRRPKPRKFRRKRSPRTSFVAPCIQNFNGRLAAAS